MLTALEKQNGVSDNTPDTGGIAKGGKRNATATPQNTVYDSKDKEKDSFDQENTIKSFKASSSISNQSRCQAPFRITKCLGSRTLPKRVLACF